MDETPEEMEQIRREAGEIDVNGYRRRFRWLGAIGLGAAMAGLVWLIMAMLDGQRNPCANLKNMSLNAGSTAPYPQNFFSDATTTNGGVKIQKT